MSHNFNLINKPICCKKTKMSNVKANVKAKMSTELFVSYWETVEIHAKLVKKSASVVDRQQYRYRRY